MKATPAERGLHRFETKTEIARPPEGIFPFFAAPENLQRITPPELRFEIISPLPMDMRQGSKIEYRLRLEGIPFRWLTEISEWDAPRSFTDRQLRGPYHTWIHRHTFEPTGTGTLMRDRVDYRLPFWPLGEWALPIVRRKIRRIFAYRAEVIREILK